MDGGVCPCGCWRTGLSERSIRRHMTRVFGSGRPVGRPRERPTTEHHPPPHPVGVEDLEPADSPSDIDLALDIVDDPAAGSDSVPDAEQRVCAAVDARIADASVPCRAQLALDRAAKRKCSLPVVRGGHLSAEGVLVIAAILGIRFSFSQVATTTVLEFVGAVLPDDNVAPCSAMFRKFTQAGLQAIRHDMCLHECVVFRDAHPLSDPEMKLQLRRAEQCPSCLTLRLEPGTNIPAHVRPARATQVELDRSAQFKYALPLEESIKHLFARPDFVDSLSWDNLPQKSPWINAVQMLHLSR